MAAARAGDVAMYARTWLSLGDAPSPTSPGYGEVVAGVVLADGPRASGSAWACQDFCVYSARTRCSLRPLPAAAAEAAGIATWGPVHPTVGQLRTLLDQGVRGCACLISQLAVPGALPWPRAVGGGLAEAFAAAASEFATTGAAVWHSPGHRRGWGPVERAGLLRRGVVACRRAAAVESMPPLVRGELELLAQWLTAELEGRLTGCVPIRATLTSLDHRPNGRWFLVAIRPPPRVVFCRFRPRAPSCSGVAVGSTARSIQARTDAALSGGRR